MALLSTRFRSIVRRAVALGWPVSVQQGFSTLMRTVDIVVTGLFSPAAVAAVGLADLYGQVPLRVGLGLGAGSIALSSQDTGRGATDTRDRAITQAILIGALAGLPLVVVGLLFSRQLIALYGAEGEVVRLGGTYLTLLFAAAPMRIVGIVGSRSLQGTGDTRTPMVLNGVGNALNIVLTVALGLGVWIAPELGIVGVGVATVIGRAFIAVGIVGALATGRTTASLARPRDFTITRQIVAVSTPTFAEGMSTSLANFPFNSLLLVFGTEANAAYHIGRRIYQQCAGPLYRAFNTVSSIITGQTLGEGDADGARYAATAILALSVAVVGSAGAVLFVAAEPIVSVFTQDPTTVGHAVDFTRAFGVSLPFMAVFFPLAGALRGAGDTRTPFYARLAGGFVFMLGASYLLGVILGFGLMGVYAGLVLSYVCWAAVVAVGFFRGGWRETAASMISERAAAEEAPRR